MNIKFYKIFTNLDNNYEMNAAFCKNLHYFKISPHSVLTRWHGIVFLSANIDLEEEKGAQLLFAKLKLRNC